MKGEIKFIYFRGCPNAEKLKKDLENLGFPYQEIEQTQLPKGHPDKDYSSPALLFNGELIVGTKACGGGCSLELPTCDFLKEKLLGLLA